MNDYISPEEMAALINMDITNVYRILRADQKRPPAQRRIQGAEKVGGRFRGEWRIPRAAVETFQRSTKGRPRTEGDAEQSLDTDSQ